MGRSRERGDRSLGMRLTILMAVACPAGDPNQPAADESKRLGMFNVLIKHEDLFLFGIDSLREWILRWSLISKLLIDDIWVFDAFARMGDAGWRYNLCSNNDLVNLKNF